MSHTVNISISSGGEFSQIYHLTNPDMSPRDITGARITANIAKHSRAYDITTSTSEEMKWEYLPFKCYVESGVGGIFSISLSKEATALLEEGKYVYGANITDVYGNTTPDVVSGLAFVDINLGGRPIIPVRDCNTANVPISETPPPNPKSGDLWHNKSTLYIYYIGDDGREFWVETND